MRIERNALHDNWDDADGYYSKLRHLMTIFFASFFVFMRSNLLVRCPFSHFLVFVTLQLTGLENCWMAVMKLQQLMVRVCSQQLCGQKILNLVKMILKKLLSKLFATMIQCKLSFLEIFSNNIQVWRIT